MKFSTLYKNIKYHHVISIICILIIGYYLYKDLYVNIEPFNISSLIPSIGGGSSSGGSDSGGSSGSGNPVFWGGSVGGVWSDDTLKKSVSAVCSNNYTKNGITKGTISSNTLLDTAQLQKVAGDLDSNWGAVSPYSELGCTVIGVGDKGISSAEKAANSMCSDLKNDGCVGVNWLTFFDKTGNQLMPKIRAYTLMNNKPEICNIFKMGISDSNENNKVLTQQYKEMCSDTPDPKYKSILSVLSSPKTYAQAKSVLGDPVTCKNNKTPCPAVADRIYPPTKCITKDDGNSIDIVNTPKSTNADGCWQLTNIVGAGIGTKGYNKYLTDPKYAKYYGSIPVGGGTTSNSGEFSKIETDIKNLF